MSRAPEGSSTSGAALADRVLAGDPRAVARAISLVENDEAAAAALVGRIFARTGRAYVVGVTGPPGAGKSTLVDRLIAGLRQRGRTVGVIAVDPTSPFTGGAILGDRIRMQMHAGDPGVFIRSMATRGHLGGLARATDEAALVLDAAGKDVIVVETVGVGQDEVEIVRTADVTVLVLLPGTGDEVQALKAGIMEIADVFVVNKADREGAERMVASIESMLALESFQEGKWRPPILKTQATSGQGVPELLEALDRFREASASRRTERRRGRTAARLRDILSTQFAHYLDDRVLGAEEFGRIVEAIASRRLDPYQAAADIMRRAIKQ